MELDVEENNYSHQDADNEHDMGLYSFCENSHKDWDENDRVGYLEEQYDILHSSVIALTSHFSQVQLRIHQIIEAPDEEKKDLLKNLEEFAFKGIPNIYTNCSLNHLLTNNDDQLVEKKHQVQIEVINEMKKQLEDLEYHIYNNRNEFDLPENFVDIFRERQNNIINQVEKNLNVNIKDPNNISVGELKEEVDNAIQKLVNPMKATEHLVNQLKTQIADLERFIDYVQTGKIKLKTSSGMNDKITTINEKERKSRKNEIPQNTIGAVNRLSAILQMFIGTQISCNQRNFKRNSLKKSLKINHWGDHRANLELVIADLLEILNVPETHNDSDYMSDSEGALAAMECNGKIASIVRKRLAPSIQNLMQHGLIMIGQSTSVVPFVDCLHPRVNNSKSNLHAWELVLKYYEIKNGDHFNSTPARKLSQSFNLDIEGCKSSVSHKQCLLSIIGNIISSHSRYKRSYDSCFKALVCAGLNAKMLVNWLRFIFKCQPLVELYYQPWSYVAQTGFEDALHSLEKLNQYNFELPVDLAIRQLQNIKDAF
ncbi:RUN domain-containing protein 1 [Daktulosphaira vitifoliae]|uniref:RUN domain-containing protein 1 n=1 Tax=Daktulosphaira vitifoliae TaxID=58002 RepID=UPI0021AA197A|nr:RUN domain-containing protein 1 [Daktulosphaira vitifoliae]